MVHYVLVSYDGSEFEVPVGKHTSQKGAENLVRELVPDEATVLTPERAEV